MVLSLGAIGSPQLLLLSGIGPRHHLQQHGIEQAQTRDPTRARALRNPSTAPQEAARDRAA